MRLTARGGRILLHYCLEDGGVIQGKHFREELAKEGGPLCIEDAFAVLVDGIIYDPPEIDIKTGEWKWKIEGKDLAGNMSQLSLVSQDN